MSKPSILWQSHLKNSNVLDDIEVKARAYLLKYLDIEGLMADIKAVALGNAIISDAIAGRLIDLFRQVNEPNDNSVTATLSIREIEVLRLVAGGDRNGEIAGQLYISEATVKAHLRNIMDKLQVKNRAQAVAKAISNGVLERYTLDRQFANYTTKLPMKRAAEVMKSTG
jgi:DNA-binding NarL/FixJ family response regulator